MVPVPIIRRNWERYNTPLPALIVQGIAVGVLMNFGFNVLVTISVSHVPELLSNHPQIHTNRTPRLNRSCFTMQRWRSNLQRSYGCVTRTLTSTDLTR